MLKAILAIFRSNNPTKPIADGFAEMVNRSVELTCEAGQLFFGEPVGDFEVQEVRRSDVKINKLQRKIRKRVLIHLAATANSADLPYCMLLMSLVKDVERIGDYAKDLVDLHHRCRALPSHELVTALAGLRELVEGHLRSASDAFSASEIMTAKSVLRDGQKTISALDDIVGSLAESDMEPRAVIQLALAAHYYKRICSHALNLVSSIVQPFHHLDDYDPKHMLTAQSTSVAS